jgi:hypothetical protein
MDPKKLFIFSNHSSDIILPFYTEKYQENAKIVNLQPFKIEIF